MKKFSIIAALFLLSAALSGCACQHTWADANCANPQICTKCEETSGDALGHDWVAASCIAPETCSRCGETNGAPAEHCFGEWIAEETQITHICEVCGLKETEEVTHEVYLDMLLRGYWDIAALVKTQEQEFYSVNVFDNLAGEYLAFEEGQILTGMINQEAFSGTWEFYQLDETDGSEIYIFQAIDDGGRDLEMHLTRTPEQDILSVFFDEGVRVLLTNYNDVTPGLIGTWETDSNDYALRFREDRTVTCTLNEEFLGTWHLTPMQEAGSLGYYMIYIIKADGSRLEGSAIFSSPDAQAPYCISLNWNAENIPNVATNFMIHTIE